MLKEEKINPWPHQTREVQQWRFSYICSAGAELTRLHKLARQQLPQTLAACCAGGLAQELAPDHGGEAASVESEEVLHDAGSGPPMEGRF